MKKKIFILFMLSILSVPTSYSSQKFVQKIGKTLIVNQQKSFGKNTKRSKTKLFGTLFVGSSLAVTGTYVAFNNYVDQFFL